MSAAWMRSRTRVPSWRRRPTIRVRRWAPATGNTMGARFRHLSVGQQGISRAGHVEIVGPRDPHRRLRPFPSTGAGRGCQVVVTQPEADPVEMLRRAPAGNDAGPARPDTPARRGTAGLRLDQRGPVGDRPRARHGREILRSFHLIPRSSEIKTNAAATIAPIRCGLTVTRSRARQRPSRAWPRSAGARSAVINRL